MIIRQGDVMLEKIQKLPSKLTKQKAKNGKHIIAYGEVTGHCHAIEEKGCEMYVADDGRVYLTIEEETEIKHDEHEAIKLPAGIYTYVPQREYTPQAIKNVLD